MMTRSGRSVRPPIRFEPDPDQVLEDDFSEEDSDLGCVEEAQTEDGSSDQQQVDSEESDFTPSDSNDGSCQPSSESSSDDSDAFFADQDDDEIADDSDLEWETLTSDTSDDYSSEDDQDL